MDVILLKDWMTTQEIQLSSKITDFGDHYYHNHNFYEIFYILNGKIDHVINGVKSTLEAGNIVFLRPNDAHAFLRNQGNDCKHRDIVIRSELFQKACDYLSPEFKQTFDSRELPPIRKLTLQKINDLEQKFKKNICITPENIVLKKTLINSLLVELLSILHETELEKNHPAWLDDLLSRFNMVDYFTKDLDVILEPYNYVRAYMCRYFKKEMSMTMTEYLNLIRLNYAANLLTATDNTILSIALDSGFPSISHFNTEFRKRFKQTPSQFRTNHINIPKGPTTNNFSLENS